MKDDEVGRKSESHNYRNDRGQKRGSQLERKGGSNVGRKIVGFFTMEKYEKMWNKGHFLGKRTRKESHGVRDN